MNPLRLVTIAAACLAIPIACGSATDRAAGASTGDHDSGSTDTSESAPTDASFVQDPLDSSSSQGDDAACFGPVDMFIMFDRSGSMGVDCNIGAATDTKWCHAVNALSGYFNSVGATNQAAAIQFFPLSDHTPDLCATGDRYDLGAVPTSSYLDLPTNAFDDRLNAEGPQQGGNTPTEAAIRGLTRFTAANRRGGRVTIGILVTDGDPLGCNEDLPSLAALLAAHNQATSIRTYVIGMQGASFANLEILAGGGGAPAHPDTVGTVTDACGDGSGPCRHWNVGNGDPAVFTAALAAIQDSANGCKDGGGVINPK